jgi:hypothetical protein
MVVVISPASTRSETMNDDTTTSTARSRRVLGEISTDGLALRTTREGLQVQLAGLPVERSRASEITKLHRLVFNAEGFADGWRLGDGRGVATASDHDLLKAWVDVRGRPSSANRSSTASEGLSLSWPPIDSVRPAPAPDYGVSVPA